MLKCKFIKVLAAIGTIALTTMAQIPPNTWHIGSPTASDVVATLEDGTLTISGSGVIRDFDIGAYPWESAGLINVVIEQGIMNISGWAFSDYRGSISIIPNERGLRNIIGTGTQSDPWLIGTPTAANVTAVLNEGTLTIRGTGEIRDFGIAAYPWESVKSSIINVVIEQGVTNIPDWTFRQCSNMTSIILPEGLTHIGSSALHSCNALTSIHLPASVIENTGLRLVFTYTANLTSITVAEGSAALSSVDGVLFNKTQTNLIQYPRGKPGAYTIPDGVTNIGGYAIYDAHALTSVTIPASVSFVGSWPFSGCAALTSITVAEDNANFSSENGVLFNKTKTQLLKYPEGKEGTSYTIPAGVTTIGFRAFSNCSALVSVTIPASVTSIENAAFERCHGLTELICLAITPPSATGNSTFDNVGRAIPVRVPAGSVAAYRAAAGWRVFTNIVSIGGDIPVENIAINATNFPCDYFRSWVRTNIAGGREVLTPAEVEGRTTIVIRGSGISNLKGIEFFTNLVELEVSNTYLNSIDVSKNVNLIDLVVMNNRLTSIDLSKNTKLEALGVSNNQLASLDLSNNRNLEFLFCNGNNLTSLDVTGLKLEVLQVQNNYLPNQAAVVGFTGEWGKFVQGIGEVFTFAPQKGRPEGSVDINEENFPDSRFRDWVKDNLAGGKDFITPTEITNATTIDASNKGISDLTGIGIFVNVAVLNVSGNNLTSINITNNIAIKELNVNGNKLTELDVSKNTNLQSLSVRDNLLGALDVSKNTALEQLDVASNNFASEESVSGLGNTKVNQSTFDIGRQKTDVGIDATNFPDSHFRNWVSQNLAGGKDFMRPAEIAKVTQLDASGAGISNLAGIGMFVNVAVMNVSGNNLTSINVTNNVALKELNVKGNRLPSLDVSKNPKLQDLNADGNRLTALDVSQNPELKSLSVRDNLLSTLDVKDNPALEELNADGNQLTALDVSENPELKTLSVRDNLLSMLDVENNPALEELNADGNQLTALDVSDNPELKSLSVRDNLLKMLDLSSNPNIEFLDVSNNILCTKDNVIGINNARFDEVKFVFGNQKDNLPIGCVDFEELAMIRFGTTMVALNNRDINGCFIFVGYEWYRDGILIGREQSFYEGPNGFSPGAYHVVATTSNGNTVESCPIIISPPPSPSANVRNHPELVMREGRIYVEANIDESLLAGAEIVVFNTVGSVVARVKVSGRVTELDPRLASGHLFVLVDNKGLRRTLRKVTVK